MSAHPASQPEGVDGSVAGAPATDAHGGLSVQDARPDPREEDHAAVRLAIAGDEQGFADLVSRYERRAWRVARNMVPTDEDAQDLVQEAFMRVFRSLDRFDFSHAFSTWLYRIVTNLAIDLLRKRRPTYSTTGSDEDESDPDIVDERTEDPSAELEREETVDEVQACLNALAPHFQSALVLRELEGMPCNEIADIVGATHVTVRWRLHRGRKLFQEERERRERDQELKATAKRSDGNKSQELSAFSNGPTATIVDQSSADEGREAGPKSKTAQIPGDSSPASEKHGHKK